MSAICPRCHAMLGNANANGRTAKATGETWFLGHGIGLYDAPDQGGIGYDATARVVLLAGENPENPGERALVWVKGNLSAPALAELLLTQVQNASVA